MLANYNKRQVRVEIAKRTSASTWGEWIDITDYFVRRLGAVSQNLDDTTLQGKLEQASVAFRFNNESAKFNPEGTDNSLWNGVDEFFYHSRLRYWEIYEQEEPLPEGDTPTTTPLIDGLIAGPQVYDRLRRTVEIVVNSKLDILREHYILEDVVGRIKRSASQSIIKTIEDLFNNTYSELGVITTGGLFRQEMVYDNITPYDQTLLQMLYQVITDGGGIGGLRTDNQLFFTYYGNTAVTRSNFTSDGDTLGLWLFDEGSGAIAADSSGNSKDLTLVEYGWTNWRASSFFDNAASRTFSRRVSGDWASLEDYTIEMLIDFSKNRVPSNRKQTFFGTTIPTLNPLFVWTEFDDEVFTGPPPPRIVGQAELVVYMPDTFSTKAFEGIFYNEEGDITYVRAHETASGLTIDTQHILIKGLGETFFQYLAFTFDYTAQTLIAYINGTPKKVVVDGQIGTVSNSSKVKLIGCGFDSAPDVSGLPATITAEYLYNSGALYYNSMKLSEVVRTPTEIFTNYTKLFGSTFDFSAQASHILDNYDLQNIEKLISYDQGDILMRNFIILEDNATIKGYYEFYVDDGGSDFTLTATIEGTNYTASSGANTKAELVRNVNVDDVSSSTNMPDFGLFAELVEPIEGHEFFGVYSQYVRIYTTGKIESNQFSFTFTADATRIASFDVPSQFVFDNPTGNNVIYYTLLPHGDNQLTFAKNETSILAKGSRIQRVANASMLDTPQEIQNQLDAHLAALEDPRARMTLEVPFNYKQMDIMDSVQVRLAPDNVNNFGHFTEGGPYLAWEEIEGYRFKNFLLVGKSDNADGNTTTIFLIENLEV